MEQPLPTQLAPPAGPAAGWNVPAPPSRSFGVGELLAGTFSVWARSLLVLAPLGLLSRLPAAIGAYFVYRSMPELLEGVSPGDLAGGRSPFALMWENMVKSFVAFLPYTVVGLVTMVFVAAAVAHAAARRLAGERPDMGGTLRAAFRAYPATAGAFVIAWLVSIPATLLVVLPFILAVGWCATIPLVVVERLGPLAALRRSWELTRGHRWELFAGFLVVYVAMAIAGSIVQSPVMMQLVRGRFTGHLDVGAIAVTSAVTMLLQGIVQTLLLVTAAVAYHGLRRAKEGQEPELLRRVFE